MRLRDLVTFSLLLTVLLPASAAAQTREPHALSVAIGGDVGLSVIDDDYHAGFSPSAFAEVYLLPRISVRWTTGFQKNTLVDQYGLFLEQYRNSANVVFNWDSELWHPFVTAGGGWHSMRGTQDDGPSSEWVHRAAANGGVGIEYFARPKLTIKSEATYYWVSGEDDEHVGASGWVLSVGLKKYF